MPLAAALIGWAEDRGISLIGRMGGARVPLFIMSGASSESLGEATNDGPLSVVRARGMAEVDCDALFPSRCERLFCSTMSVRSDRREVRLTLESTRWKLNFSSTLDLPLSSTESS